MFKTVIIFPSENQLEIREYETGYYNYIYRQEIEEVLCYRRRWEWHRYLKEKPHIHDHLQSGKITKIFTKKYTLKDVLKEIKREFEPHIKVHLYKHIIQDRMKS